jgi:hypothetical protein
MTTTFRACPKLVRSCFTDPVDDPKSGWGLSIFSAKDQMEVERLTEADPIILDDVGCAV